MRTNNLDGIYASWTFVEPAVLHASSPTHVAHEFPLSLVATHVNTQPQQQRNRLVSYLGSSTTAPRTDPLLWQYDYVAVAVSTISTNLSILRYTVGLELFLAG